MISVVNEMVRRSNSVYLKNKGITLPTYAQMKNPNAILNQTKALIIETKSQEVDPLNLYRITWKNAPIAEGGGFQQLPNYIEFPSVLTGVKARIIGISGKFFPTGAHKVGSSLSCLIPKIVSGEFDLQKHQAIWPSTGNFCRGGAFNSSIIGCHSIAVLPENMSRERFEWLSSVAGEVIRTRGSESNVKEIYDMVKQLQQERDNVIVFNQFCDIWNYLWHYDVTGNAIIELFETVKGEDDKLAGICLTSGSSGTLGCGDAVKQAYPAAKLAVGEAIQCPTLLMNGYGEHWIEGIGDKHVPWIHNVRNTDMVIGMDDRDCLKVFELFNKDEGKSYLSSLGIDSHLIDKLNWCGISGIGNLIACIKFSKYYELSENDIVFTVLTDSSDMYQSKLSDNEVYGFSDAQAAFHAHLSAVKTDYIDELSYKDRKRIHNLKYYTWVEQQGFDVDELNAQWYDTGYWENMQSLLKDIDIEIEEFNHLEASF